MLYDLDKLLKLRGDDLRLNAKEDLLLRIIQDLGMELKATNERIDTIVSNIDSRNSVEG